MLRSISLVTVVLWPTLAFAQMPEGMPPGMDPNAMMRQFQDPAAMERMQREAEAAQACFAKISEAELKALEKKGKQAGDEIDALCAAGKKKEALAKAIELSREMQNDPTIKQLRECSKGMTETQKMMRNMPWAQVPGVDDEEPTDDDICS
ncbi:MAG: hypothetical protein NXI30_13145 [bacterium]|nr:hypothetical protein [bacterium]